MLQVVDNNVKDIYKLIGISNVNDKITINMAIF